MKKRLNNQQGFTLIEIIAVLILLGILAAVAVPKYIDLTDNAKARALQAAVSELNGRENMVWAKVKLSGTTYATDAAVDAAVRGDGDYDTDLNATGSTDYSWTTGPTAAGGVLEFQGTPITLVRGAATLTSPANWHE
jgi:prepilin-type N-terminal cleavage/methylation domain-containing protein